MSASKNVHAKAAALVAEDAVSIAAVLPDGGHLVHVTSLTTPGTTYTVTVEANGGLLCSCPARSVCSHSLAARWVAAQGSKTARSEAVVLVQPDDPVPASDVALDTGRDSPVDNPVEAEVVDTPDHKPSDEPGQVLEHSENVRSAPSEIVPAATEPGLIPIAHAPVTWRTLEALSRTEFVPTELRGRPTAVLGAVLMGREYGLGPLSSLRAIDVIDGSPSPNAELMLRSYRLAGHVVEVLSHDSERCVLRGTRGDTAEVLEVVYSIEDAQRAGLSGKANWERSPSDMLWARAVSRLVRRLAPDCLGTGTVTP